MARCVARNGAEEEVAGTRGGESRAGLEEAGNGETEHRRGDARPEVVDARLGARLRTRAGPRRRGGASATPQVHHCRETAPDRRYAPARRLAG